MSKRKLTDHMVRRMAEALYLRQARATNHYMARLENRRAHPPLPFKTLSEAEQRAWKQTVRHNMSVALRLGWRPPIAGYR